MQSFQSPFHARTDGLVALIEVCDCDDGGGPETWTRLIGVTSRRKHFGSPISRNRLYFLLIRKDLLSRAALKDFNAHATSVLQACMTSCDVTWSLVCFETLVTILSGRTFCWRTATRS